jgi:hypothetical protein
LLIDPANGDAPVVFQWDVFHTTGISDTAGGSHASVSNVDLRSCPGTEETCSFLIWDTVIDNYLDPITKGQDILFFGLGARNEYTYFKNSKVLNGWKCTGGPNEWTGPNGLHCDAGEDSAAHSDGIQLRGQPVNGGWFIMQDSVFANGFNFHMLHQVDTEAPPHGNMMFQGVLFGRTTTPMGASVNWVQDCLDRRDPNSDGNGDDICPIGRSRFATTLREVWMIDVWGTTNVSLRGSYEKVVVINTGCNSTGCDGTIGYTDGWAWPIDGGGEGPGDCPNGLTAGNCSGAANTGPCYCYTSVEKMLADTSCPDCPHKPPPFVNLSCAGHDANDDGIADTRQPELFPDCQYPGSGGSGGANGAGGRNPASSGAGAAAAVPGGADGALGGNANGGCACRAAQTPISSGRFMLLLLLGAACVARRSILGLPHLLPMRQDRRSWATCRRMASVYPMTGSLTSSPKNSRRTSMNASTSTSKGAPIA